MARIATLFASGCLIGRIDGYYNLNYVWLFGLVISSWIFCLIQFRKTTINRNLNERFLIRGTSILVFVLLTGSLFSVLSIPDQHMHDSVSKRIGKTAAFLIEVISEPRLKNDKLTVDCKLVQEIQSHNVSPLTGNVRLHVQGGLPVNFQLHKRMVVFGKLSIPQFARIPGDFNYQGFLAGKGIFSQIRLDTSSVFNVSETVNSIQRSAFLYRSILLNRFSDQILAPDEMQVASALLLGDRTEMSSNLMKEYSSGGIIHILAVSGLHVGLIYQALVFLFGFIPFLKKFKLDLLLIIILLWIYAAMTGLSPSVNRAVCMFTLIAFAGLLNRKVSPFNMLGSAAFILLIISPCAIVDMGFQLSFAAVWGILSARPVLDYVQHIRIKVVRFISGPLIISIAAQLATAPVALFAFGTFPVWFLPANLIAVPLSTLLTYLGLVTLIVSDIPFLGTGLMTLFAFGLKMLNAWARLIGGLPWAKLDQIHICGVELFFFSISIIVLFSMLLKRSMKHYFLFFISLIAGFVSGGFNNWITKQSSGSLIYCSETMVHVHYTAPDTIRHYILLSGKLLLEEPQQFQLNLPPVLDTGLPIVIHTFISEPQNLKINGGLYISESHSWRAIDANSDLKNVGKNSCLIVADFDLASIRMIKEIADKHLLVIPAPWMRYKKRHQLSQLALQFNWNLRDPMYSGWFYLNEPNK